MTTTLALVALFAALLYDTATRLPESSTHRDMAVRFLMRGVALGVFLALATTLP